MSLVKLLIDYKKKEGFQKMKNRSLIDEGMDAIFDLEQVVKHIDERLEELRKDIETYVGEVYDPTVIARYDELTRIKHLINKLNQ